MRELVLEEVLMWTWARAGGWAGGRAIAQKEEDCQFCQYRVGVGGDEQGFKKQETSHLHDPNYIQYDFPHQKDCMSRSLVPSCWTRWGTCPTTMPWPTWDQLQHHQWGGYCLLSRCNPISDYDLHWSNGDNCETKMVKGAMHRNRFRMIKRAIHFGITEDR